jgi:hypothetical protein
MPIYTGKITEKHPFSYERFIYHDKIPTSSLLLRVRTSDNLGFNDEQIPDYNSKIYSTMYN